MGLERKHALFFLVFTLLVLLSSHINFSPLLGADNQFFTVFQFFGPIAGGIMGAMVGGLSVLIAQLGNFVVGKEVSLLNLLRVLPMVFAAFYFGSKSKKVRAVAPLVAIGLFLAHPVGREVWFFSLFWTIPLVAALFPERLYLRSLGSTFTAHAVGGAIWIWSVPMTPEIYMTLIPIVAVERLLFAAGISVSYIAMTTIVDKLDKYVDIAVEKQYVLSRQLFSLKLFRIL